MTPIRKLLETLNVADLSLGMTGALSTKFLVDVGARVRKLEPPGGDPFYERYAAYATWQVGKTITRARHLANTDEIDAALSGADVCVIGGATQRIFYADIPVSSSSISPAIPQLRRMPRARLWTCSFRPARGLRLNSIRTAPYFTRCQRPPTEPF